MSVLCCQKMLRLSRSCRVEESSFSHVKLFVVQVEKADIEVNEGAYKLINSAFCLADGFAFERQKDGRDR